MNGRGILLLRMRKLINGSFAKIDNYTENYSPNLFILFSLPCTKTSSDRTGRTQESSVEGIGIAGVFIVRA